MQIYRHKRKFLYQKKVQLPQTSLENQHGRRFIVLGHQYVGRDVIWKRLLTHNPLNPNIQTQILQTDLHAFP